MAKYIDVEPLMNGGWQLQRYNSGNGYVNQEHASLKDIPPADVVPVLDFNEAFFTISRAYKEDPSNKILRDYLLKNACCIEENDD